MADERWGLVGAGQCGRRIAAAVCERTTDGTIDDRVALVGFSQTLMRAPLDRLASALDSERSVASRDHLVMPEVHAGLGNTVFDDPAAATAEAASVAESIAETTADADAILYALGLGGQVGNSVVPRIVDHLSHSAREGVSAASDAESAQSGAPAQVALGVWPFEYEPPRRHFDAVCVLSRLLRRPDGTPNADLTLLASNARLSEIVHVGNAHAVDPTSGRLTSDADELAWINDVIADAIRLFVGAEQPPHNTDPEAIPAALPYRTDARHGTLGTALGKPIGLGIQYAIRQAVESAFVPLDPSTVENAHVVVRAPEQRVEAGDVTEHDVREGFDAWSSDSDGSDPTGGATLSAVPGDGNTFDVIVFLSGFDLAPLLSTSWDGYEMFKDGLMDQTGEPRSDELIERVRQVEANLRVYCDAVDEE